MCEHHRNRRLADLRHGLGLAVSFALLVSATSGCDNGTSSAPSMERCVPGVQIGCGCAGGGTGVQVCTASGRFDTCSCSEVTDAGPVDGASAVADASADASVDTDAGPDAAMVDDASVEPIPCTTSTDPDGDTGTYDFAVNSLQVPPGASTTVCDGLDLDARTTSSVSDAAGCFHADTKPTVSSTTSNVDNQFAPLTTAGAYYGLDLSAAMQNAVAPSVGAATIELRVRLRQWNMTPNDACVVVELHGGTPGTTSLIGTKITSLSGGVSTVMSGFGEVPLQIPVSMGSQSCLANANVTCSNGQHQDCSALVPVRLFGARLRVNVQPVAGGSFRLVTNRPIQGVSSVANPSILAGFVYWGPRSGAIEADSFRDVLQATYCELGQGSYWTTVNSIVSDKVDLHSDASGSEPTACTGTSASNGDQNALSVGLYFGSGY